MNKMGFKKFLSRKDNILTLITICIAILLLLLDLFSDILVREIMIKIIILILTLIAITNMVERETRFAESSEKIDDVRKLILNMNYGKFIHYSEIPNHEDLAKGANEFFIAGAQTFSLITRNMDFWQQWLKHGKSLKIIIQNPTNEGLKHLNIPTFEYDYKTYKTNIQNIIKKLKTLDKTGNSNLEIRVNDTCPTQGVLIVDGHLGGKAMIVNFYLPNCDSNSRPHVVLESGKDTEWFKLFHTKYYKTLWKNCSSL
jgi:hypothetical protein